MFAQFTLISLRHSIVCGIQNFCISCVDAVSQAICIICSNVFCPFASSEQFYIASLPLGVPFLQDFHKALSLDLSCFLYINDFTKDLKCAVKMFADDTSIFTVVRDPTVAAIDLNHDLEHIKLWANQWRMSFSPDLSKRAVEITFSTRRDKPNHPILVSNNSQVRRIDEHKHFGLILDSKLSFSSHIHAAIFK